MLSKCFERLSEKCFQKPFKKMLQIALKDFQKAQNTAKTQVPMPTCVPCYFDTIYLRAFHGSALQKVTCIQYCSTKYQTQYRKCPALVIGTFICTSLEKAQWPLSEVGGPPREARGPLN